MHNIHKRMKENRDSRCRHRSVPPETRPRPRTHRRINRVDSGCPRRTWLPALRHPRRRGRHHHHDRKMELGRSTSSSRRRPGSRRAERENQRPRPRTHHRDQDDSHPHRYREARAPLNAAPIRRALGHREQGAFRRSAGQDRCVGSPPNRRALSNSSVPRREGAPLLTM
jgi:hypothetical protein